jgi:F0F1-type ATP synthase membrane subunit c/vacuolar-type H+-ATPase subunit K
MSDPQAGQDQDPADNANKGKNSYIAVGIAIGVAIGVAMDALGLGIALGVCIGVAMSQTSKSKD